MKFILDFGSGNTCRNNKITIKKMIDDLCEIDKKKNEIIIKWQLFKKAGENIPLAVESFDYAFDYASKKGYETTASIFDEESLLFLLNYKIPFIKIANNPKFYYLGGKIPNSIDLYVSTKKALDLKRCYKQFACISKYPATLLDYESNFNMNEMQNISDHTSDFSLFEKYFKTIKKIEWHYKLKDSVGLDAGEFARTPEALETIINLEGI